MSLFSINKPIDDRKGIATSLFVWVISMISFFIESIIFNFLDSRFGSNIRQIKWVDYSVTALLVGTIAIGVIAFFTMILFIMSRVVKHIKNKPLLIPWIVSAVLVVFLVCFLLVRNLNNRPIQTIQNYQSPSLSPVNNSSQKVFTNPTKPTDASNNNTNLVNCNINANCGGGTMLVTKEECKNKICCQLKSGWQILSSMDVCLSVQKSEQNNSNSNNYNYVYPTTSSKQNITNQNSSSSLISVTPTSTSSTNVSADKLKYDNCVFNAKAAGDAYKYDHCTSIRDTYDPGQHSNLELYRKCLSEAVNYTLNLVRQCGNSY